MSRYCLYISLFILGSCQFYSKIEPPKPVANQSYLSNDCLEKPDVYSSFFKQFNQPDLINLLEIALKNNQDLLIAIEKVQEAQKFYGVVSSEGYPALEADFDAQRTRSSKSGFSEIQGTPFGIGVGQGKSIVTNIFIGAMNLSWEIDFFGRIRNQNLRAKYAIQEQEAAQRSVTLSVASDVALTYFSLNTYTSLIDLSHSALETINQMIDLKKNLFATGLDPEQGVWDLEKDAAEIEQNILDLQKNHAIFYHHLAQLTAVEPSKFCLQKALLADLDLDQLFCKITLPSEMLRNRPDMQIAEKQLIQAGYSVKVAAADFFPTISLLGAFGFANNRVPGWFTHSNSFWTLGPTMRWPAFQGFQFLSQYEVEKSRKRQAALQYQSTLLKALEDVENCLVGFFKQEKIARQARIALEKETLIFLTKSNLTDVGLKSMEYTLEAKLMQIEQQKKEIIEKFKTIQSLILLYKALGGEWK